MAAALLAACQQDRGEVEIDWTLVDRAGSQIFPSGALEDTCAFVGRLPGSGDDLVDYEVLVEVNLCEPGCEPGCGDPSCVHTRLTFDCTSARGYATVEARPEPYDFDVHLVAAPADGACACDLQSPCALIPGPRRRTVEPGLVTDLAVYLMVLGLDDIDASQAGGRTRLDLAPPADDLEGEPCCVPDPACAAANSAPVTLAKPARPG
jgi:hypothetical protein